MAWEFTVSIPDEIKTTLIAAYADAYNYDKNGEGMTKKQFALSKVRDSIRAVYKGHKVKVFNQDKETVVINADFVTEDIIIT